MTSASDETGEAVGSSGQERLTVNLIRSAARGLSESVMRTGRSKTETIHRYIALGNFMEAALDRNAILYIQEPGSDELRRVIFL